MTMGALVSMYEKGAITADHLAAECIHMIDPQDPEPVLGDLPDAIMNRVLAYARRHRPGQMVSTYGTLPAADQVEAVRTWIENHQRNRESTLKADR